MARTETHTADLQMRQPPPIILPTDKPFVREPETILQVDKMPSSDYADDLAFAEEPVTIRLERGNEKNAATSHGVWVNGRPVWIPVGRPCTVARKYVEVLLRAQPHSITTVVEDEDKENPVNRVERSPHNKYPLSIIRDDSPRSQQWIQKLMMEA